MSQRVEHIVLIDVDEQRAPPSQYVLKLEIIPKGGSVKEEVVSLTIAKLEQDGKSTTLTNVTQVCVNGDVLTDVMNLLRKVNK